MRAFFSTLRSLSLLLLVLSPAREAPAAPATVRIAASEVDRIFVAARVDTHLDPFPDLAPDLHYPYLLRQVGALVSGSPASEEEAESTIRILRCPEEVRDAGSCRRAVEHQRAPGESLFRLVRPTRVDGQDRMLTVLEHGGWENNPAPLASWRVEGDDLVLEGIADPVFLADLSVLEILEVRVLGHDELLLIGRTWGGDGGEMWRTLWVARWRIPRALEVVFAIAASGGSEEAIAIEHDLRQDLHLEVRVPPSDVDFLPDQSFAGTLDLAELFRNLDAGQSLVDIHRQEGWVVRSDGPR